MKSNEGKNTWINTLLVTTTGWGGDPSGQVRVNAENSKWWRFDGSYRRFDYFRFLNNFVNPNWAFTPPVPPNPVTGEHGYDTKTQLGDFELTLLPKDRRFHFTVGYSPERYSGPAFTNYHLGGNDFNYPQNLKSRADDYRFGAEARVAGIDLSFMSQTRKQTVATSRPVELVINQVWDAQILQMRPPSVLASGTISTIGRRV